MSRASEELVLRFIEGRLDDEEVQSVVDRLRADPEFLDLYCAYADLDSGLRQVASGPTRSQPQHQLAAWTPWGMEQ